MSFDVTKLSERYLRKLSAFAMCAAELGSLSTCKRKPCGCLLVAPDFTEILAIGYNGPAAGLPNDSCAGEKPCGCVHAEANCLVKARRHSATGLLMVVTRAPCLGCAGLIVNSRAVTRVVWVNDSTGGKMGGIATLNLAGIDAFKIGNVTSLAQGERG